MTNLRLTALEVRARYKIVTLVPFSDTGRPEDEANCLICAPAASLPREATVPTTDFADATILRRAPSEARGKFAPTLACPMLAFGRRTEGGLCDDRAKTRAAYLRAAMVIVTGCAIAMTAVGFVCLLVGLVTGRL